MEATGGFVVVFIYLRMVIEMRMLMGFNEHYCWFMAKDKWLLLLSKQV